MSDMNYQVVLCDADGVVIKSQYLFSEQLEAQYGIPRDSVLPFFHGAFRQCSVGKADLKIELSKVIDDWGWRGTVDELVHFWLTTGTQFDKGVIDYVRSLRETGIKTYMTTDQERYRGEYLRNTLGRGKVFDEIFFSAEVGCPKKDPAFFEYVHVAIGQIPRDRVLFIDDGQDNIAAAKQFGFDTHLYTDLDALKDVFAP